MPRIPDAIEDRDFDTTRPACRIINLQEAGFTWCQPDLLTGAADDAGRGIERVVTSENCRMFGCATPHERTHESGTTKLNGVVR